MAILGIFADHRAASSTGSGMQNTKRRAFSQLAVDRQGGAHQFGETLRDGQAKARALVFLGRRGIHLGERFEDQRKIQRGDADSGILNRDCKCGLAGNPLGVSETRSVTWPCSVNLTAFHSKLSTICRMRPGSPFTQRCSTLASNA